MNMQTTAPAKSRRQRKLLLWTAVLLMVAGGGALVAWTVLWPAIELRAAEQLLRDNDPSGARDRLGGYLARWPSDKRALFLAVQAARRSDACADAEQLLTRFEEASGPTDGSRLEWVLLGAQQGDFCGEEDHLHDEIDRNRARAPLILEALAKGYSHYRWPEALAALEQLFRQSPNHVPALLLRGKILDHERQSEAAEKDFRRAVELAPQNPAAQTTLAGLLYRLGHTREALHHYELAAQTAPADSTRFLGLARALTDSARLAEAQTQLDQLLELDPNSTDALVERARLALRQSRFAEAERFLARTERLAPWHRAAMQLHSIALKELKQTAAAAECEACLAQMQAEDGLYGQLKLRARDTPGDVAVRWDLWLWCARNGQMAEGVSWLMKVLRLAPGHIQAHQALADYFERIGQPRRAQLHRDLAAGPGKS
jgi:tetratricopeptide (TPR) repeat protein